MPSSLPSKAFAQGPGGDCLLHTFGDMNVENLECLVHIPGKCRLEKLAVFLCRRLAAKAERKHLISQVMVEDAVIGANEKVGAAAAISAA